MAECDLVILSSDIDSSPESYSFCKRGHYESVSDSSAVMDTTITNDVSLSSELSECSIKTSEAKSDNEDLHVEESEGGDDVSHSSDIEYYKSNKDLPVYQQNAGIRTYGMTELFMILMEKENIKDKICQITPCNVEHNVTFVVDRSHFKNLDDIKADDCGGWRNNGIRRSVVSWKDKKAIVVERSTFTCKKVMLKSSQFLVERSYYVHRTEGDFGKVISTIQDKNKQYIDLVLVQYYFTGEEHPICGKSHGNSHGGTPYKRTQPSTLNSIKEICKTKTPVATIEILDEKVGDIIGQKCSGARVRNAGQVSNARRKLKLEGHSQLADVMELCKSGQGSKGELFVRCVQAAPEPMCLLATERQLDELERNCTDSNNFVPVGVDPTFKLGQFYVTPIVFPLRMLVTKRSGKSPIYLGPLLIHNSQKFISYHYFASQLLALRPRLKQIRAIGTDGEAPLYEAFSSVFPDAVHVRCFNHVRKNIERKLHDLNFPNSISKEILVDIFGSSTSDEKQLGLVDSHDVSDYRQKLEQLKFRWDHLERLHRLSYQGEKISPQFHAWFVQEKAQVIEMCMLPSIRQAAGMGKNPDHFYTNMCESINNTLKCRTEHTTLDLRPFVDKVYNYVETQENLIRKAVIRNDRWRFRDEYKHLEIDLNKWFNMSENLQKKHIKIVYSENLGCCMSSPVKDTLTSSQTQAVLSVDFQELVNSYSITTSTLRDIWEKAAYLLSAPDHITLVPGQGQSENRIVASLSGGMPHYVVKKSGGQFICSGECPRFSTNKICQHIIAAAEHTNHLQEFCKWWKLHFHGPNIDKLASLGLPKGVAGQKGGKAKRIRKRVKAATYSSQPIVSDHVSSVASQNLFSSEPSIQPYCSSSLYPSSSCESSQNMHETQPNALDAYVSPAAKSPYGSQPLQQYETTSGYKSTHTSTQHMSPDFMPPHDEQVEPPVPHQPETPSNAANNPTHSTVSRAHYQPPVPVPLNTCVSPHEVPLQQYGTPPPQYGTPPNAGHVRNSASRVYQHISSPPMSPHGAQPYVLKMLTKKIKICAGCRMGYNNSLQIPDPPYDICIAHGESRRIPSSHTHKSFITKTTAHYHANPQCIYLKDPTFLPTNLQIPSNIQLSTLHKTYLNNYFGLKL